MADKYDIEARYVPALACSVPFMAFGYYFLKNIDSKFWDATSALAIGSLGISAAMFLVAIHLSTTVGKVIELKLFRGGLNLPTTEFLLAESTYLSEDRKKAIRNKIKNKFGVDIRKKTEGTLQNRQVINEAVGEVRRSMRKNKFVLQKNIQYGLTRNLLSGSMLAFLASLAVFMTGNLVHNTTAVTVATVMIFLYLLFAGTAALLFMHAARQYASMLFDEFMGDS